MEITIRHIEDCPNVDETEERIRRVLRSTGDRATTVRREVVRSDEEAERLRFCGSPTILIDGRDPFDEPSAPSALACRLYMSAGGPDGAPSLEQLERALAEERS